ncbi:hypothetical protein GJAV_G00171830 [Gymnothorax javanicus]|nr:hypothetical protein GJAV_G00171830 [Gymnothorax javanicus]
MAIWAAYRLMTVVFKLYCSHCRDLKTFLQWGSSPGLSHHKITVDKSFGEFTTVRQEQTVASCPINCPSAPPRCGASVLVGEDTSKPFSPYTEATVKIIHSNTTASIATHRSSIDDCFLTLRS